MKSKVGNALDDVTHPLVLCHAGVDASTKGQDVLNV